MDDNESIDKSSLYHEPFNVNMYTSAASGCSLNDLQRNHVTPDYTGNICCYLYTRQTHTLRTHYYYTLQLQPQIATTRTQTLTHILHIINMCNASPICIFFSGSSRLLSPNAQLAPYLCMLQPFSSHILIRCDGNEYGGQLTVWRVHTHNRLCEQQNTKNATEK